MEAVKNYFKSKCTCINCGTCCEGDCRISEISWLSLHQYDKLAEIIKLYEDSNDQYNEVMSLFRSFLKKYINENNRFKVSGKFLDKYICYIEFTNKIDNNIIKYLKKFVINYNKKNVEIDLFDIKIKMINILNQIESDKYNNDTILLSKYMTHEYMGKTDYELISVIFGNELADYLIFDKEFTGDFPELIKNFYNFSIDNNRSILFKHLYNYSFIHKNPNLFVSTIIKK